MDATSSSSSSSPWLPRMTPRCVTCKAVASPTVSLFLCPRCNLNAYCCRDHQVQHWSRHRELCDSVQSLADSIVTLERELRAAPPGANCPGTLFEHQVGRFGSFPAADNFLFAKATYVRAMSILPRNQSAAAARALPHALDCLRLDRSDVPLLREAILVLMLLLGQLQDCYDFLKWRVLRSSDGQFDWSNPAKSFRSVRDADVTESIAEFKTSKSPFVWSALTFVKLTLANMLEAVVDFCASMNDNERPPSHWEDLDKLLKVASGVPLHERSVENLLYLQTEISRQAIEAFSWTRNCDPKFWQAMLRPKGPRMADVLSFALNDTEFSVRAWLLNNAAIWHPHYAFIKKRLANP